MAADCSDPMMTELIGLTEDERKQLMVVLKRAKEFEAIEEKHLMRQPLEGQLYKYTNVMKGWQYRWFALDPDSGRLEYFEKEEHRKQRPRGSVHLAGAVISPSDEDSQTFTVNASNGEIYRLRAFDTRERQLWVDRLRATAEYQTDSIAQNAPPLIMKEGRPHTLSPLGERSHLAAHSHENMAISSQSSSVHASSKVSSQSETSESATATTPPQKSHTSFAQKLRKRTGSIRKIVRPIYKPSHHGSGSITSIQPADSMNDVKDSLSQVQHHEHHLVDKIEGLSATGEHINALDEDMLMLKATSSATIACLEQCLNILQNQNSHQNLKNSTGASADWSDPRSNQSKNSISVSPADSFVSLPSITNDSSSSTEVVKINHDEEVEDAELYTDTELEGMEEHKSIILHLLSQLKLGMDLTKVVLPTFILERRSLLEMFADCMAHPDQFLSISEKTTPEARMLAVVEWYLLSFHASRKGSIAKKPYNPIIGEHFHCSWELPRHSQGQTDHSGQLEGQADQKTTSDKGVRLYYVAEQVSHHPPISAFYFECPEKQICMNASIWTKSKFMGMSIGVVMIGKVNLKLLEYDEEYVFTLPSAYARSILTVPWVELGDRVQITCAKTGHSASVVFHTKPFYGGKLHRVTSEVKNAAGDILCKVNGEWNGTVEFTYANGESKLVDTNSLNVMRKRVRPLQMQADFESRKLWQHVTEGLKRNDIDTATQHKRYLEERQRQGERHRKETGATFPTKYFHSAGESWLFNHPMQKGQTETTT